MSQGSIQIICGPMFSGKTEELIRKLNRLHYAKTDFLLFKPRIDNRYDSDRVVSHGKLSLSAHVIENAYEILKICEKHPEIKHIGIDEIQFLPNTDPFNAFKLCFELKKRGYQIVASGLDMDYKGQPFPGMGELLCIADDIIKPKAVCFMCGEDAGMTSKLIDNEELIDVGTDDKYQSLCFKHWLENSKKLS